MTYRYKPLTDDDLSELHAAAYMAEEIKDLRATPVIRQIIDLCRLHADHPAKTAADHGAARLAEKILKILEGET